MHIYDQQKSYYKSGQTRPLQHRLTALNHLKDTIKRYEAEVIEALHQDLNKSEFESYTTEIGILYTEIDYTIKHLKKWMKPKKVKTALTHVGTKGKIYPDPYGVTLIIAPWNYPFQLAMAPLIGAIAGGNTAIVKPSELTPHTAEVIKKIITAAFIPEFIAVKQGGVDVSQQLLDTPFDYIFFTGSVNVGKIVMEKASKYLTPHTLELGGKSPAIVHEDASLKLAAKRIAWGKFINAGQTCVAPDYVYVHQDVKDDFLTYLTDAIEDLYSHQPLENPDYTHIVSDKHFDRLTHFLDDGTLFYGGDTNKETRAIAPTVLTDITWDRPVMAEEIFGPILPVMTYENLDFIIDDITKQPKPLALYLFTERDYTREKVIAEIPFGGGCINDTIYHLATPYLPFGGVGQSGTGNYHGKFSFDTFTHQKSILKQTTMFDVPLRYPNQKAGLKWVKKLMK
ncbi:aldehyde dehydrogenase (NAD+) [Halolactibacillus halophilus]|uniref:Aldehyde dehydrogenase n=1 Tax=Halolactibacillus halophilus TaxID=306540 RepID=A0A1I5QNX4_9BACI|nr:aldehyde dehydrogenase [Halolactibacillus halophilus]GEM01871.1 aldehyde dehydrogenase [Halolactibacillus halophilus]SFP47943.1 aldehyde dehydrogenase (NAD+) [Halolactibacillus halophilus]